MKTCKQTLTERTAEAVKKFNVRILGKGHLTADNSRFWLVTSREYATTNRAYLVQDVGGHLECNCPAEKPCIHICLVGQTINAERKEAAQQTTTEDAAKWALIEQVMPARAAEMHQAAQEATAMLAEMVEKMDAIHLDENLWGDGDTDAPAPKMPACSNCRKQPAAPHMRGQLCIECFNTLTAQMNARQEAKRRETAPMADSSFSGSIFKEVA